MRIAIGGDDVGVSLLAVLADYLAAKHPDMEVIDLSAPEGDRREYYPDVAERVAMAIVNGQADRGILICGTGLGMAMSACKVPGIRAATCHDPYSAERAIKSNNAQIMTMGARVVGVELAKTLLETGLQSEYVSGTRSEPKVNRMIEIDARYQAVRKD
jgi:ribose 5-phosphate isomerase B